MELSLALWRRWRAAVTAGRIWLTEPGEPDDHFVAAGQAYRLERGGAVVIEGDSTRHARVQVGA